MHIVCITARIEDGDEIDDWNVTDYRTGDSVPLRADRWYQSAPKQDQKCQVAILEAFESKFGTEPRFDASLLTLLLVVVVTTGVTMLSDGR